jgi:hypothetical protein
MKASFQEVVMKILLMFLSLSLFTPVFAGMVTTPAVNNNVIIMSPATPAQCKPSWTGRIDPAMMTSVSRFGTNTGMDAVGVQSCSGCALDGNKNCVCRTCYGYYN